MDDAEVRNKTILVTGFEPFGGQPVNPALEAVMCLAPLICGYQIVPVKVPVSYGTAFSAVKAQVDRYRPCAVIMVGQAAGRDKLSLERIAINVDDCEHPDNDNDLRVSSPIDPNGSDGLFATLPLRELLEALDRAQIPSEISNTAGTYVCNHLMYEMLAYAKRLDAGCLAGFIHVPLIPSQTVEGELANKPSMPLETITKGLTVVLEALARYFER